MNKKVKGIVAVAVTAVILAGMLFACSRKSDTPKSTDSSLTTSITKEEQSSDTDKSDKDKSDKSDKDKSGKTDKSGKKDNAKSDKSNKDEVNEKETSNEVETSDEAKENSTKSENQSDKSDKSNKPGKTDKKPDNKKPEQTKSQKETKKNNVIQGTTKKQTQSTTKRQTQSTTQRQTQSTTRNTTKSTTARPADKDKVEFKTETKDYSISYRTVDNYSSTRAESRVYQQGKNGTGRKTYKVKYVNGVRQNAELVSDTVVTQAQDHIIERYVQVEAGGIKRVPKRYEMEFPVYEDFWFANCIVPKTGEARQEWFKSAKEAADYHTHLNATNNECQPTNWGGPQAKQTGTRTEIIDDWEEIEVPAKFEWRH